MTALLQTRYFFLAVFAASFLLVKPVLGGETYRSAYVKLFKSCSLQEATNHTVFHADECKYACLEKQSTGNCRAYQWDAETRTCRLQETLNMTASSAGDSVGVLMDADTPCPCDDHCHLIDAGCGQVNKLCQVADCTEILAANPASQSGVYNILAGTPHPHKVWCDMDTDGGGWTVFLKRLDGSMDFYQDLATYKLGFGNVSGEYWLGLDVLHAMTSSKSYQLRVDIADWEGASAYSLHQSMVVAGESDNYRLALGDLTGGEGGGGFKNHDQMEFSAKDADRDLSDVHCAQAHHGGFWYNKCCTVNPTGKYYIGGAYTNSENDGIQWRTWTAHLGDWRYSQKTVEMKLRP